QPAPGAAAQNQPAGPPVGALEFVGKVRDQGRAKFLLLYPLREAQPPNQGKEKAPQARRAGDDRKAAWVEVPLELDFARADKSTAPAGAGRRKPDQPLEANDLEGLWAAAQAGYFAVQEALSSDPGFYGFAREVTGRKYGVPAPAL